MEKLCPLLRGPCVENRCHWYTQLLGNHPQKDAPVPEWGCAISWMPILQIEIAKEVRQHAAAVESSRNQAQQDTVRMAHGVLQVAEALRPPPAVPAVLEVREAPSFLGRLLPFRRS